MNDPFEHTFSQPSIGCAAWATWYVLCHILCSNSTCGEEGLIARHLKQTLSCSRSKLVPRIISSNEDKHERKLTLTNYFHYSLFLLIKVSSYWHKVELCRPDRCYNDKHNTIICSSVMTNTTFTLPWCLLWRDPPDINPQERTRRECKSVFTSTKPIHDTSTSCLPHLLPDQSIPSFKPELVPMPTTMSPRRDSFQRAHLSIG